MNAKSKASAKRPMTKRPGRSARQSASRSKASEPRAQKAKPASRKPVRHSRRSRPVDDPLSTVHPVPNPNADSDRSSSAAPTKLTRDTVPAIKAIDLTWNKKLPPDLIITVKGRATLGPWEQVKLERRVYVGPPADGVWEFDLAGERGNAVSAVGFTVTATYEWIDFPVADRAYRGVRIYGKDGGVLEKLFLEPATPPPASVASEEPPTKSAADYAPFLVPLPTRNALLFRAGEWELFVTFRAKGGGKSEGAVGLLLHKGSVVAPSKDPLQTELGQLTYKAPPANPAETWQPLGWLFEGDTPSSEDYPELSER